MNNDDHNNSNSSMSSCNCNDSEVDKQTNHPHNSNRNLTNKIQNYKDESSPNITIKNQEKEKKFLEEGEASIEFNLEDNKKKNSN